MNTNTLGDRIERRTYDRHAPTLGLEPPEWTLAAVCQSVDPELFHPEKGGTTAPAKLVCRGCPVTAECLQFALDHSERFGIWGGLSERERRRLSHATRPSRVVPCGTPAAYRAHYRRGEKPCAACTDANNEAKVLRRRQRVSGAA